MGNLFGAGGQVRLGDRDRGYTNFRPRKARLVGGDRILKKVLSTDYFVQSSHR